MASSVMQQWEVSVALAVILATVFLAFILKTRLPSPLPQVRKADTPAILSAGSATLLSGDLVSSVIVRSCSRSAQVRLKATSRAWRDAVREEVSDWMDSETEIGILAFAAEMDVDALLAAERLALPPPSVIGHLSPEEGKGVGVLLRFNHALTHLSLRRNTLGDPGIMYVAAALRGNTTLTSLIVDSNELGDEGGVALVTSLKDNQTLTFLSMRENGVGPEVHFRHDGESEGIGDETAKALAQILAGKSALRTLWLGSCEIGDEGARALASVLGVTDGCEAGGNGSGGACPKPVKQKQKNASLTELDIRENQLSEAAKEELRVAAASRGSEFTLRV